MDIFLYSNLKYLDKKDATEGFTLAFERLREYRGFY